MTSRERFLATVLAQPKDRVPYWLFWGIWGATWKRWQMEGLPREFKSFADVRVHFGAEEVPKVIPVRLGPLPDFRAPVCEDADSVTYIDSWGIRRRDLKAVEGMAEFVDWPVKSRDDWRRYRDERLDPKDSRRLDTDWRVRCQQWATAGIPMQLGAFPDTGIFGGLRWLLGDEECLLAFCTEPDWVHEIM